MPDLQFSETREDLLFDYTSNFSDVFRFAPFKEEVATSATGNRYVESLGFDFQNECTPVVEIKPISEDIGEILGGEAGDFNANIFVVDTGLGIRKQIFSFGLDEVHEKKRLVIYLKTQRDLAFYRGFEIQCSISLKKDREPLSSLIWNKSQLVYEATFIVRASIEEALFEITWASFANDSEKKDLLYYIDWKSVDVSTEIDNDCFSVIANNSLKDQFIRLNNNRHFGELCIRMIATDILSELSCRCLEYCDLDIEPQTDSLHEKIFNLFEGNGLEFGPMAKSMQCNNGLEVLSVTIEVRKFFQKLNAVGSTLDAIKFGGYRG